MSDRCVVDKGTRVHHPAQFQALPLLDTLSFEGCRLEALPPCVVLSTNLRALNLHNNLLEDLPYGPYLHG